MNELIEGMNRVVVLDGTSDNTDVLTTAAKNWASHSLETYRGEMLTKALDISKALVEFATLRFDKVE